MRLERTRGIEPIKPNGEPVERTAQRVLDSIRRSVVAAVVHRLTTDPDMPLAEIHDAIVASMASALQASTSEGKVRINNADVSQELFDVFEAEGQLALLRSLSDRYLILLELIFNQGSTGLCFDALFDLLSHRLERLDKSKLTTGNLNVMLARLREVLGKTQHIRLEKQRGSSKPYTIKRS